MQPDDDQRGPDAHRSRLDGEMGRAGDRLAELEREFDAIVAATAADPPDDEHDPDGATVGFERAQLAALIEMSRARLHELEAARTRAIAGTYGRCDTCGRPIGAARLDALPAVTTCIACASRRRRG